MTSTATSKRYSHRDRLGRFVRRVNLQELDMCAAEGQPVFVNDSADETHAHDRCGNLKGRTFTTGTKATGWLCSACIEVPVPAWIAAGDIATSKGQKVCDTCHATKGMRSFPTVAEHGWRFRGATCRKCEAADRTASKVLATV